MGKRNVRPYNWMTEEEAEHVFMPIREYKNDSTKMKQINVVVIILESFSREFVGVLNENLKEENGEKYRGYTPFLDSLIQESYVFTRAYANGRRSIDAMPAILASIPSLTMPYIVSQYCNNKINSLASILGNEGYETAFFHGASNGSMSFDSFANIAGFDKYYGKNEYNNDDDYDGWWGIWDHLFFQYFADNLEHIKEPFMATFFSLSSHHPYSMHKDYEGVFRKGPLQVEECVGYSDNALRLFFEKAKTSDWFNNTLFVLTADHCCPQIDHKEYNNTIDSFAIPIIFYAPCDSTLRGKDNNLAQQTDIMPTILSYLGYSGSFIAFGNNLFDENADRFVLNCHEDMYQLMRNDTVIYFDGRDFYGEQSSDKLEKFIKSYIQQYNNRLIEDRLTIQ